SLNGSSTGGAAVALDPQTGAVLALASSPSYDPTWWTPNGISTAHYNQLLQSGALNDNAIQGLYTPGSTFKLATATAALQTGLFSPYETYDDTGSYTIPGCSAGGLGCARYHDNAGEAAGVINISQALTVSSDIFFYNLGVQFWDNRGRYGETPIQNVANQYSMGEVTGIDLPDETQFARVDSPAVVAKEHAQDPKAYPNSGWFTGNNLEMAFGQGGTLITPIEQAVAFATFANGGTRYVPQIGAGIVTSRGKVVDTFAPKVVGHVSLSAADYQAMLAGFEGVVQNPKGTAYSTFAGFPLGKFPLAGKTGTATTNELQPNSWFVGFGPVPNSQYVIAVVVQGGGYGSSAAGSIVRKGFDYLVAHPEAPTRLAAPAVVGSSAPSCTTTTTTGSGSSTTTSTTPGLGASASPVPSCQPVSPASAAPARVASSAVTSTSVAGRSRPPPGRL
ncbi:MAG: penicillin-binding transpeptidase domain-containing protein, partial [Acidimicrobiales bacterium]